MLRLRHWVNVSSTFYLKISHANNFCPIISELHCSTVGCSNGEGDLDITEIDITESAITNFQEIDITESDITEKGNCYNGI